MRGKDKCKILKEIRQKIADENDIEYVTRECGYQGECTGTCPRCESELRYLEQQLEKRRAIGRKVTLAALCAGITAASTGCAMIGQQLSGEAAPADYQEEELAGAAEEFPEEASSEGQGTKEQCTEEKCSEEQPVKESPTEEEVYELEGEEAVFDE